jgi:hypothetical protein
MADVLHQAVEQRGGAALKQGLALALAAHAVDDVGLGAISG